MLGKRGGASGLANARQCSCQGRVCLEQRKRQRKKKNFILQLTNFLNDILNEFMISKNVVQQILSFRTTKHNFHVDVYLIKANMP